MIGIDPLGPRRLQDGAVRMAVPYKLSRDVHELLVLLTLSGGSGDSTDEVQTAMDAALHNVIGQIASGLIELDYHPEDKQTVNIPAIDHPHYMQALLYWSTLLDCRPAQLADAYARLGRQASAESVAALVKVIATEETMAAATVNQTSRFAEAQSTLPTFANTTPIKFR